MQSLKKVLFGIAYWFVLLTWGALWTTVGSIIFIFLAITGHKIHHNGCSFIVEVGKNWGGLNLGPFAMCGRYSQKDGPCYDINWFEHTRCHEFGHGIQQMILGPLWPFTVGLASVIRYWVFYFRSKQGKHNPAYDQAIFEYTASKWGHYWVNKLEGTDYSYTFKRQ